MSKRSGKPYDAKKSSFVQRMKSFIPNRFVSVVTWLGGEPEEQNGAAAVEATQQQQPSTSSADDSPVAQAPPNKRMKTELNAPADTRPPAPFPSTMNYLMDDASSSSGIASGPPARMTFETRPVEDVADTSGASTSKSQLYGLLFDPNGPTPTQNVSVINETPKAPVKTNRLGFDLSVAMSPSLAGGSRNDVTRSPFYTGKTCYGGASAHRRSYLSSPRSLNTSRDSPFESSLYGNPILRQRGRESLELTKSPNTQASLLRALGATLSESDGHSSLKRKVPENNTPKSTGPPNRSLNAPTVRDMMQMKVNVARNLTLPKSKPAWKESATFSFRQDDQPGTKHSNKVRRNEEMDDLPEPVNLPRVGLQMNSLPKFDFAPAPPAPSRSGEPELVPFTFSAPIDAKSQPPVLTTPKTTFVPVVKPAVHAPTTLKNVPVSFGASAVSTPVAASLIKAPEPKLAPVGFGNMFKKPAGMWSCSSCMVDNKAEAVECCACKHKKEEPQSKAPEVKAPPMFNQGFGAAFKKPANNWECAVCLVSNKPELEKCAACQNIRSKPQDEKKKEPVAPLPSLMSMFKKPEGNWECSSCMLSNLKDVTKCAACSQSRPGSTDKEPAPSLKPVTPFGSTFAKPATEAPAPSFSGFGNAFKKAEGSWDCSECMVNNKPEAVKCVSCETARKTPAKSTTVGAPTPALAAPVNGFGDMFKKPADTWTCSECMVNNKKDDVKCVACQTANPSAPKTEVPEKPKFSFGVIPAAPSSAEEKKQLFSFGATKETGTPNTGFVFGQTPAAKTDSKPVAFGMPPTPAPMKAPEKEPEQAVPSVLMFNPPVTAAPKLKRKAGADELASPPKFQATPSFFGGLSKPQDTPAPEPKKPSFNFLNEPEDEKPKPASAVQSLFGQTKPAFFTPAREAEQPLAAKPDAPAASPFQFSSSAGSSFAAVKFDPKPAEAAPAQFNFGPPAVKQNMLSESAASAPKMSAFSFQPPAKELEQKPMGGFAFGNPGAAKPASDAPIFGAKPAPALGGFGEASGMKMFGSLAPAPSLGGAAPSTFGTLDKPPVLGGFNFSPAAPSVLQPLPQPNANMPVGGFNFGAFQSAPTGPPVPQFNPEMKPTFNFSGNAGAPTFNASGAPSSSQSPAMQQRRIRKAVRRIPQQPR